MGARDLTIFEGTKVSPAHRHIGVALTGEIIQIRVGIAILAPAMNHTRRVDGA